MVYKYFKYILLLFIVWNVSVLHAVERDNRVGLLIPLYSDLNDIQEGIGNIWDAVAAAGQKIPITAIIGVNLGEKEAYENGIIKLHQSNIRVLAYVSTALSN